ncbi:MAG TPA: hypothetical protein VFS21_36480, partial [Roseiflexaceae bacterium]|nr:hypothetical protein [Roseiflexaceae bacterium]
MDTTTHGPTRSNRHIRATRIMLPLLALIALSGCADGGNPLTDTGWQQDVLSGANIVRFIFWVGVAIGGVMFVLSYVMQSVIPEWHQSQTMKLRVGGLLVFGGAFFFNWAMSQAEASMGT